MRIYETIRDALFGMAIGDALGVPFEFEERGSFVATGYHVDANLGGIPARSRWKGVVPWGAWSDDTSMALSMMDAIIDEEGRLDMKTMMVKYWEWWNNGDNCSLNNPFGLGGCVYKSMSRFEKGIDIELCGCVDEDENGNGSLMHILPLAFTNFSDDEIRKASAVTHAHELSTEACVIYVSIARKILAGCDIMTAIEQVTEKTKVGIYKDLKQYMSIPAEEVESSGFVVHTLKTALWCVCNTTCYKDAVLQAVNFGYDTDTVACVAGGLAGIIYGVNEENGIPQAWIDATLKMDFIEEKCRRFAPTII
ncbi:MAG: ADP-ribosylglycohydrolase family protein [Bacteroidales bacterium]|nr:ADP-ribosylglycohydrolase family protein [Bacteroidales bacterium]